MGLLSLAFEYHKEVSDKKIKELIALASKDQYLGDIVLRQPDSRRRILYYDSVAVGLCWPRRESDGRYRTGPIFVSPAFRNKGVASSFIVDFFSKKKGRAYIEDSNHPSIAAYKKAGFKKTGKVLRYEDVTLFEYLN